MSIDLEELAAIIRLVRDADFSEFRYEKGEASVVIRRGDFAAFESAPLPRKSLPEQPVESARSAANAAPPKPIAPVAPSAPTIPASADNAYGTPVNAPLLGTFYGSPKPGEPPFVRIGDRVEPDTVVCIIEVMKLMNSVVAGISGTISAVHVGNGDLVDHGQTLFSVDPAK